MKKNWARVLIHECTHTECQTQDKGYAYKGIGPGLQDPGRQRTRSTPTHGLSSRLIALAH